MAKVRDKRRFGFFIVENSVIDTHGRQLGVAGLAVYCLIVRHADWQSGRTWPTYATMTARLGISRRTCARAVRKLVQLGLVEVERAPGIKSVYTLRTCEERSLFGLEPRSSGMQQTGFNGARDSCQQETASSSVVAPPQFPGGMRGRRAPYVIEQDPTTATGIVAAAGDELGVKNDQGRALLADQGVAEATADRIATTTDIDLLKAIVAYWQGGAGGVKPVGTGLLVAMCQRPGAYGFVQRDGNWFGPKVPGRSSTTRAAPESSSGETPAARRNRLAAEARARREQDVQAQAEFARAPKIGAR